MEEEITEESDALTTLKGGRRGGVLETEAGRKEEHKRRYGGEKLPLCGTGLRVE